MINVIQNKNRKKNTPWCCTGSNRGPSACKADVITTTLQHLSCLEQTAGISFRAFYKLGTEPLPLGLEMLISKLIFQNAMDSLLSAANQVSSLAFYVESRCHGSSMIGC